jgi:hypothetical protein
LSSIIRENEHFISDLIELELGDIIFDWKSNQAAQSKHYLVRIFIAKITFAVNVT